MKLRGILKEIGTLPDNKYRATLKSSDISMRGKYKGKMVEDCHSCELEWVLNYEAKSWGIRDLDIYVNWARIMFDTASEKDIEVELTQDNCEFISEVEIGRDSLILVRECEIEIDINGKFKFTYS